MLLLILLHKSYFLHFSFLSNNPLQYWSSIKLENCKFLTWQSKIIALKKYLNHFYIIILQQKFPCHKLLIWGILAKK